MSKRVAEDEPESACAEKKLKIDAEASIDVGITNKNYKPRLRDVQNLLLRTFTSEYGENAKWLCIRGMPHIMTACVLLIPMLDAALVRQVSEKLPLLSALLQCPGAVGANCLGELQSLPRDQKSLSMGSRMLLLLLTALVGPSVTDPKKKKAKKEAAPEKPGIVEQGVSAKELLASEAELARSGYPQLQEARPDPAWITTDDFLMPQEGADPDLLAFDCEMVKTCSGLALARVSVVNSSGETLYDTLVKPTEAVIDYVTEYSGITQSMLEGITTTLSDVQAHLKTIIHKNSFLVGHSLECDFKVLQLAHEQVIDTAILYQHPQGWPLRYGLNSLVQKFLSRSLDRKQGHDSVADAKAALELVQLKMEKGIGFGAPSKQAHPLGQLLRQAGTRLVLGDVGPRQAAVSSSGQQPWHFLDSESSETCQQEADKPLRTVRMSIASALESYCGKMDAKEKQEGGQVDAAFAALETSTREAISSLQSSDVLILMASGTSKGFPGEEQATSSAGGEPRSQQQAGRQEGFSVFLTAREAKTVATAAGGKEHSRSD